MERERDYYRHHRERCIKRKKKIIRDLNDYWHYTHEGVLSKGKIHCSCWMCRRKSYDEPKMQDVRNSMAMDYSEQEYKEELTDENTDCS